MNKQLLAKKMSGEMEQYLGWGAVMPSQFNESLEEASVALRVQHEKPEPIDLLDTKHEGWVEWVPEEIERIIDEEELDADTTIILLTISNKARKGEPIEVLEPMVLMVAALLMMQGVEV